MPLSSAALVLALAMETPTGRGSGAPGCEPATPGAAWGWPGAICSPESSSRGPLAASREGPLSPRGGGAHESAVARAVAFAAYGYVASELRRLDTSSPARMSSRKLAIPRPPEGLAVGPRLRPQRSAWEWVAIAGGVALVAGGIALAVRNVAQAPPTERGRGAAALLSGVKVSFSGDAGWVRFRTRF